MGESSHWYSGQMNKKSFSDDCLHPPDFVVTETFNLHCLQLLTNWVAVVAPNINAVDLERLGVTRHICLFAEGRHHYKKASDKLARGPSRQNNISSQHCNKTWHLLGTSRNVFHSVFCTQCLPRSVRTTLVVFTVSYW